MARINNAEALRDWLRTCPEIDRTAAFSVDFLGDQAGYALCAAPSELAWRENILGEAKPAPMQRTDYWLDARMPVGADAGQGLDNLAHWQAMASWIAAQSAAGRLPDWESGRVTAVLPAVSAAPVEAGADMARYRLRLRVEYETD